MSNQERDELIAAVEALVSKRRERKSRANPLPHIDDVKCCPHCGNDDEFYVIQVYSGKGKYKRGFDGYVTDNSHMYDCLDAKVSKKAFCESCDMPVAKWDDKLDGTKYNETRYDAGKYKP